MTPVECRVCRQRTILTSSVRCSCGANVTDEDRNRAWRANDEQKAQQSDGPKQDERT